MIIAVYWGEWYYLCVAVAGHARSYPLWLIDWLCARASSQSPGIFLWRRKKYLTNATDPVSIEPYRETNRQ